MSKIGTFLLAIFIVCEALIIGAVKIGQRLQKAADFLWNNMTFVALSGVALVIATSYSYDNSLSWQNQANTQLYTYLFYVSFVFMAVMCVRTVLLALRYDRNVNVLETT